MTDGTAYSIGGDFRSPDVGYRVANSQLLVGGVPLTEIVRRFGTPSFVYNVAVCGAKLARLRAALPTFGVFYAAKANPNPGLLRILAAAGCGVAVATKGELGIAAAAGVPASRAILAGAGKTEPDFTSALAAGVLDFHVESVEEADCLSRLARRIGSTIHVSLRVNPGDFTHRGTHYPARPAAYGVDEEMLFDAAQHVSGLSGLELDGLHVYFGTQILDFELLSGMYQHTLNLGAMLARFLKRPLRTIDFGGGFGVPYYAHESEFPMEAFGASVAPAITGARDHPDLATARFMVEPGRYLVAECGLYVTRVLGCKESRGKRFVIVDGGIHHHLAATGNLGHVIKRNFPMAIANRINDGTTQVVDVTGRQCTALDTLARDVRLPHAQVGDVLVVFQSGAYARSASPADFRSQPGPAEVLVEAGIARLSTEADSQRCPTYDSAPSSLGARKAT